MSQGHWLSLKNRAAHLEWVSRCRWPLADTTHSRRLPTGCRTRNGRECELWDGRAVDIARSVVPKELCALDGACMGVAGSLVKGASLVEQVLENLLAHNP
jgi:hypothetical protein